MEETMRRDVSLWTKVTLFSIVLFPLFIHPSTADTLNRVVAIVNDDIITLFELNRKMREMTGVAPEELQSKDANRYIETRRAVLEILIDERIAQTKIAELGISVSAKEIDSTVEKMKSDNHWTQEDFLAALKEDGVTSERYRDNIKKELERIRPINLEVKSKIIIRDEQVREYYEKNKPNFEGKGELHLAGIFLMRNNPNDRNELAALHKKGEEILAALKKGEDFGRLARQFSQGPGAKEGGDLGKFKFSQLEPELQNTLQELPEGGITDLIIRADGIQIIKLLGKDQGRMRSYEEVKDAIYATLYKEEVNRRYASWLKELRSRSYTKVIF
jgi:peptidyl-prolyl cis-trans isomerase SurA